MRGVNKIILIGNATRDTELRHTNSGKSVAGIRLATNRIVRDRNGSQQEQTQYHSVVCWDKLAEIASQYVTKGRLIYVEGRLEYRTFSDDEGKDRGAVEIIASDLQLLGGRGLGKQATAPAVSAETESAESDDPSPDEVLF